MLGMTAMGLYSPRQRDRMPSILLRVALALALGTTATITVASFLESLQFSARTLMVSASLSWLAIMTIRWLSVRLVDKYIFKKRVLVYGCGKRAQIIATLRRKSDQRGFLVKGYVPASGEPELVPAEKIIRLSDSLLDIVNEREVDEIVVAMDDRRRNFPTQELLECRLAGVAVTELMTFMERETGKLRLEALNASWLIFSDGFRHDVFRRYSERGFDLLVSTCLLVIGLPFMLIVALAIKCEDGISAEVLYRQPRVGYGGRIFDMVKFRSMRSDAEKAGKPVWASENDTRVTHVGAVIRKLRLDELPQLFTVLKGRMSFVGPRPERPEFVKQLAEKIPFYRERHYVKPGIAGWAQLCYPYGASENDAREKLQYDLYYVKNHGLLFDILILLQTVEVILLGKGAR
jgi:sugar transferase (PEP-CTERM system associated)